MGFHICITNEKVIDISISNGIYGNVGNSNETRSVIWSKLKDLYAVKPNDIIILYVKHPISKFYGVFQVTSNPYLCNDDLFRDPLEKYPFRFNFKKILDFPVAVPSFEFYSLIESGKIESSIGLSRDVNSSYRSIRQLFESEYKEVLQLFYKYNPKTVSTDFTQIQGQEVICEKIQAREFKAELLANYLKPTELIFDLIPSSGKYALLEDVLHAYIVYNVLHNKNNLKEKLGLSNFNELLLEAPIFKAMQYRSDILATFKQDNKVYYYSFFELKREKKVGLDEISQLMSYLKSFASNKSLTVNSYEGVYISSHFDKDLIDYLEKRQIVEQENIISLYTYTVNNIGEVMIEKKI